MQVADFGLAARLDSDGFSAQLGAHRVSYLSQRAPPYCGAADVLQVDHVGIHTAGESCSACMHAHLSHIDMVSINFPRELALQLGLQNDSCLIFHSLPCN